jgi:hypothetical protein
MFSTAISSKRANPLLKFSSVLSGRELFAKTNSEFIDAATQQRVLDTGNKTHAAVYQTILKEKWDSLTGEQQSTWNAKAEEQASNIQQSVSQPLSLCGQVDDTTQKSTGILSNHECGLA